MPLRFARIAFWIAALLKLAIAALTLGTNDMSFFRHFGWELVQHGLAHEYRHDPLFNHTPLIGGLSVLATVLAAGSESVFAFLIRLPGILADLVAGLALLRRAEQSDEKARGWLVAFAFSPTALMVSGFHGNVDSVLSMCLLFAALSAERGRAVTTGVWLGLACNIKVAALLVAPVFLFHWIYRGEGRRFFFAASTVILVGWAPALFSAPVEFIRQVIGYAGYWGIWGITWLCRLTGHPEFQTIDANGLAPIQSVIMQTLKVAIMLAAIAIAWLRRQRPAMETVVAVWTVFMVFASGVAAQYLVWPLAALFVVSQRGWMVVEIGSAIFLFAFYTALCGGFPWYYGEANAVVNERWLPWTAFAWAAWIVVLIAGIARGTSRTPCLSASQS